MELTLRQQSTIAQPVSVSGFGFWSGLDVTIEFRPAAANKGLVFVRRDLPAQPRIAANILNRIPGPRRTTLVQDGNSVEMVEHVLAALAGLQLDNCEIHIDAAEMPGMDGSSQSFVSALQSVGRVLQDARQPVLRVLKPIRVTEGQAWIQAIPLNQHHLKLNYQLEYSHAPSIGTQSFSTLVSPEVFAKQIAPARTFLLDSEATELKQQGIGSRVSFDEVLVFNEQGPIQNHLRFDNECARHKALDMIGDFSLAGCDLIGEFTASKSGHLLNSQMVAAVLQQNIHSLPNRQSA